VLKIPVFHRDPLLEEPFLQEGGALQNPLALGFRTDGKEDSHIAVIFEIGVVAVRAFNDGELFL